jgi:3-oxoacyl-[acyl-carrier-protein] synthase-3
MAGYYSEDELKQLGLGSVGINNKISKKCIMYNTSCIYIGDNCRIDDNCILSASKNKIVIGNYVHISNNVTISGNALIKLDDFSGLSSKVSIFGSTDDYTGNYMTNPCVGSFNNSCINVKSEDVIIGKHAIVGCNSVILPGCSIVSGASVGALSLVNRKITEVGIYHGNPIKYISGKSDNYLKIEKKYFHTSSDLNNDVTNEHTSQENLLVSKNTPILNFLKKNFDIFEKIQNRDTQLAYLIDSLTFIQIQNYINKNYNQKITLEMTLNDIIYLDKNDVVSSMNDNNKNGDVKLNPLPVETSIPSTFSNIHGCDTHSDNKNTRVTIIGTGHKLPSKIIPNDFYSKFLDTTDEWIRTRTGIESKYILDENETLEDLIITASNIAIKNANINASDIDLVILSSSTPEDLFGDASKISYKLGANNAFGFDIRNACNGFLTGVITAEKYLQNDDKYKIALVIGADCLSRYVNWEDRKSCILFGDGAGSIILKKSDSLDGGLLASLLKTSGKFNTILNINSKITKENKNGVDLFSSSYNHLTLDGIEVFNYVVENLHNDIKNFIKLNKVEINDISYFILHQANIRIVNEVALKLNINKDKFLSNINLCGNTSAASIPILLDEVYKNNKLKKNDLILFSSFGAGMSMGLMLFKWTLDPVHSYNKIALITGGTKGIGKSIANKLSNKGYKTIVCSRTKSILNNDIEHYICDISNLNELKNLYETIIHKYGRIDILINNAGIAGCEKPFIETDFKDIDNIMNVNLIGTIYITKLFAETLKKYNGTIINISSIAAANNINNCFRRTLYSMTKSAIGVFTRGLAGELKNYCNVYSINPPFVDTNLLDEITKNYNIDKSLINQFSNVKNINKLIKPSDIANIISLIIDQKTRYKSGDEILVISENQTTYMKYLYSEISTRDNIKFEINDIESYKINNICLFQGQGVNVKLEIPDLAELENYVKNTNLDLIIKNITNHTFKEIIEKNQNACINTLYQQLMIFIVSYIKFEIEKINDNDDFFKNVTYMVGYSLGEITALVCSSKISFEHGLKIVFTRAYYMHLISQNLNTSMITVKGITTQQIKNILHKDLYISINYSDNINIIGGDKTLLEDFKKDILSIYDVKIADLLVEGAFHTPHYKEIDTNLIAILDEITFNDNDIKIFSNYNSTLYAKTNFKYLIINQISNTVQWNNIINILKQEEIHNIKEINLSINYLSRGLTIL